MKLKSLRLCPKGLASRPSLREKILSAASKRNDITEEANEDMLRDFTLSAIFYESAKVLIIRLFKA
jgi:hypothetical protein